MFVAMATYHPCTLFKVGVVAIFHSLYTFKVTVW